MRILLPTFLASLAVVSGASADASSPDGVIVFERRSGTAVADIYSIRADGTRLRRLTRTQGNFDPAVSADGKWIVFASHRRHGPGATELYVMRVDGSGLRQLTRNTHRRNSFTIDFDPTWSPDGKRIVFARTLVGGGRSSTDLYSVPFRGGPVWRMTTEAGQESAPVFALSGEISFVRNGFVYQRVGSQQIRTVRGEDPAWSRDDRIAVSREGFVYTSGPADLVRVGPGTDPTWSPDGRSLAWVTPAGLVVDGRPLTRSGRLVHHLSPSWGPAS